MALFYSMPKGTVLGPNQTWNAQHAYVSTEAKHCDKEALIAAYNGAGRPPMRTWIKEQAAQGVAIPSYPTCLTWFKAEDNAPASPAASVSQPTSSMTTLDEVEAAYKTTIENLITSLEEQEAQLKGEMERVVNDLAKARDKLTKFD